MIQKNYININIKLKKQKNHKNINTELNIHQINEYYDNLLAILDFVESFKM